MRLAKRNLHETSSKVYTPDVLQRLSQIIGKSYTLAKQAKTNADQNRSIPVLGINEEEYSGFHQGAGESTITELLGLEIPQYSLILIDEIETSLHPSAQRRLIRDLATVSRIKKVQFIVTTHSPYILDELPNYARIQIINDSGERRIVLGVSSEFALSYMDDVLHPEMDIYVEDDVAKILIEEIIAAIDLPILKRVQIISFGSAQVGKALGLMNVQKRFPRPTLVILDGDQEQSEGCILLPGTDAPERQIYYDFNKINWLDIATHLSRSYSDFVDAAQKAMTLSNHHEWNKAVADKIIYGGNDLWRILCRSWVKNVLENRDDKMTIVEAIRNKLGPYYQGIGIICLILQIASKSRRKEFENGCVRGTEKNSLEQSDEFFYFPPAPWAAKTACIHPRRVRCILRQPGCKKAAALPCRRLSD